MERNLSIGLDSYKRQVRKSWITLAILFTLLIVFMFLSVSLGSGGLSFIDTIKGFFYCGDEFANTMIWDMRMPRVIGAILCGAGLALSGCIMQTCLRNPLASPSTIGVGSAATFGANIAIIGFGSITGASALIMDHPYAITICAFAMAIGTVLLVMLISKLQNFTPESIILAGTALSALFGAGTTLLQYFADESQLGQAIFWTFGDLSNIYWPQLLIIVIVLVVAFIFFMSQSWAYNVMITGEESAKSLGVKTNVVRILGLLFATLLTATIVSFVGMIGFIGLIAPHVMKRILGQDHRFYLPSCALAGSVILLLADTIARTIISPIVLPVGAITSLIGAPMFIFILLKGIRKR